MPKAEYSKSRHLPFSCPLLLPYEFGRTLKHKPRGGFPKYGYLGSQNNKDCRIFLSMLGCRLSWETIGFLPKRQVLEDDLEDLEDLERSLQARGGRSSEGTYEL